MRFKIQLYIKRGDGLTVRVAQLPSVTSKSCRCGRRGEGEWTTNWHCSCFLTKPGKEGASKWVRGENLSIFEVMEIRDNSHRTARET